MELAGNKKMKQLLDVQPLQVCFQVPPRFQIVTTFLQKGWLYTCTCTYMYVQSIHCDDMLALRARVVLKPINANLRLKVNRGFRLAY